MKRILLAISIVSLLWACGPGNNVKIKGKIKDAENVTVILEKLHVEKTEFIDSLKLGKDGEFSFKSRSETPEFYILRLSNQETVTLAVYPGEKLEISGTAKEFSKNYWVDGSDASLNIKVLNFKLDRAVAELSSLRKKLKDVKSDKEKEDIKAEIKGIFLDQKKFVREFIYKNATSLASYMALYQEFDGEYTLNDNSDIQFFKVVASSLKALWPESEYTKSVMANLLNLQKRLASANLRNIIEQVGSNLPEIELPDIKGNPKKLSSLKGKYILLDFTVLSDKNSLNNNKNLEKIYNKYKSKGFVVYQVSLDNSKFIWEEAHKIHNINWINVWDENSARSIVAKTWNIKQLPANYLINPESEIVGKNLFGSNLENRLNDLIK